MLIDDNNTVHTREFSVNNMVEVVFRDSSKMDRQH